MEAAPAQQSYWERLPGNDELAKRLIDESLGLHNTSHTEQA